MEDPESRAGTLIGAAAWDFVGTYLPDWVIRLEDDLRGVPEVMCWRNRVILVQKSQEPYSSTSSMIHAAAHVFLNHRGPDPFDTKHEESAERWTARMQLGIKPLARALILNEWDTGSATAVDCKVDLRTLHARLRTLHMSERGFLLRCRQQMEIAA